MGKIKLYELCGIGYGLSYDGKTFYWVNAALLTGKVWSSDILHGTISEKAANLIIWLYD